jgi:phosphotransacetylase/acyl dehydratase
MENVKNVTFDEIRIGATAAFRRTLSQADIELLALISGDVDPFHLTGEGAASARPDARTTEAVGAQAIIAAALGTRLPGPGMTILRQDLRFRGTVTAGDVLTATVTVTEKRREAPKVVLDCRCVNQRGETLAEGVTTVAAPTRSIAYAELAPPRVELRRGDGFGPLFRACEAISPVACAIVHPCDRDSLLGPLQAARRGLIDLVLVGPEDKIRAVAQAEGIDLGPYRIIATAHSHESAARGVELARAGEVEALMKGSLHTDELMAAVVPSATGLRTSRRISHVFVMDVPTYSRTLLVTDAAINIAPGLKEKVDIVQNAIDLAGVLGVAEPKVAILAAVETVNPEMPSTLEAAALCKMADRGQIAGGILDGPLAFDNAISLQAARTKKIASPVAGQADILLVPDLEAGNILAKQLVYLAGAEAAGIVLGTRVPIVLTSRSDSVRTRLASTAVLALVAHARRQGKFPIP